ncbi:MAG: hemolysin III family protein [Dokdonella sp.]|nr:hemolysin III family protein [Dokdonella sp.]
MIDTGLSSPAMSYSLREEIASSLIHGLGIVLSIAGLATLVGFAVRSGGAREIVSVAVYGTTLILLYTASTLYHGVPVVRAKPVLRLLDHAAIFLLIAGTYTPFTLLTLQGRWGLVLFVLVWGLALAGISLELRRVRNRVLMATLYVALGWIGLVAIGPLRENLEAPGLWLLFGGGAAYTLGVPFYLWKRLPYSHAVWHGFVLLGSVLQFFAVLFYVLPRA